MVNKVIVDWMDLKLSELLNIDVIIVVNCFFVVLVFNKVLGVDFEIVYVIVGVIDDRFCVIVCVLFSEVIDLVLLIGSVVIVEFFEGDNKFFCVKWLERLKLFCVIFVVKFIWVIVGIVDICEILCVVEVFIIDGFEFMLCEEVVLFLIFLFEVMNEVLYVFEVKDFKKRVVLINNDIDVDIWMIVVLVFVDENRSVLMFELWILFEYDGGVMCVVFDLMVDVFDVGNGKLYIIFLVWFVFIIEEGEVEWWGKLMVLSVVDDILFEVIVSVLMWLEFICNFVDDDVRRDIFEEVIVMVVSLLLGIIVEDLGNVVLLVFFIE